MAVSLVRADYIGQKRHAVAGQDLILGITGSSAKHLHIQIATDGVIGKTADKRKILLIRLKIPDNTHIRQALVHNHNQILRSGL